MAERKREFLRGNFLLLNMLFSLLLFSFAQAQTCTGGLAGTNLQDCTGTPSSPCHKCDVSDIDFEIRAPDDTTTTGWIDMSYSTSTGSCVAGSCIEEFWTANYLWCPQEGPYDIRIRAYVEDGDSYDWEVSDWNIGVYTVNYDSSQQWCECGGYYWNIGGEVAATSCCEDDSGEYRITRVCNSGCTSDSTDDACCNASNKCVWNDTCYDSGSYVCNGNQVIYCNNGAWEARDNRGDTDGDGKVEGCYNDQWVEVEITSMSAVYVYEGHPSHYKWWPMYIDATLYYVDASTGDLVAQITSPATNGDGNYRVVKCENDGLFTGCTPTTIGNRDTCTDGIVKDFGDLEPATATTYRDDQYRDCDTGNPYNIRSRNPYNNGNYLRIYYEDIGWPYGKYQVCLKYVTNTGLNSETECIEVIDEYEDITYSGIGSNYQTGSIISWTGTVTDRYDSSSPQDNFLERRCRIYSWNSWHDPRNDPGPSIEIRRHSSWDNYWAYLGLFWGISSSQPADEHPLSITIQFPQSCYLRDRDGSGNYSFYHHNCGWFHGVDGADITVYCTGGSWTTTPCTPDSTCTKFVVSGQYGGTLTIEGGVNAGGDNYDDMRVYIECPGGTAFGDVSDPYTITTTGNDYLWVNQFNYGGNTFSEPLPDSLYSANYDFTGANNNEYSCDLNTTGYCGRAQIGTEFFDYYETYGGKWPWVMIDKILLSNMSVSGSTNTLTTTLDVQYCTHDTRDVTVTCELNDPTPDTSGDYCQYSGAPGTGKSCSITNPSCEGGTNTIYCGAQDPTYSNIHEESIVSFSFTADSAEQWCIACGGVWFNSISEGSNGNCCGDDGASDNFCLIGGGSCVAGTYYSDHCSDGVKNCDELDIDCGGTDCGICVDVNLNAPNGNQYINGTYSIDFNVYAYPPGDLHAKIAYSSTPGSFENIIVSDLNLSNYQNIPQLTCTSTDWRSTVNCRYSWNTTAVPDGNYYIDINIWTEGKAFDIDSSDSSFYVDNTPPSTTDNVPAGWQTSDITVTLTCSDAGSGCYATYYRIDSGDWQTYTASFTITTDGNHRIDYYSVDNLGNTESTKTTYAALDKTPPAIDVNSPSENESFESVAYVRFDVEKGQGSDINIHSIRVLIDGTDSDDFDRYSHCVESGGSYTCTYYERVTLTDDYNLAIIAADIAGHVSQVDRNFFVYTEYNLEGYTVEPSTSMESSSYSMADVGLTNVGGKTCYGDYCIEIGFPAILRNIPPSLVYTGNEYGYFRGTFSITFYASDYEMEELHARFAYSSSQGAFENIIASDLNLNNYTNITNLTCTGTDWRYAQLCTYSWDTTTASDGNYYLDLNLWDIHGDSDSYSTQYQLCIDNNAPGINITTPAEDAITSDPTISFTLVHNGCAPIILSSVQVKINGSSANFNYETDCNASGLNYVCSFYQTRLTEGDYNLSIIVTDIAGNVRQVDRNFHFSPVVNVSSIQPSGTLESGTITISFTVSNTMLNDLYVSLYYSSITAGKLSFENPIDLNLKLDEYATIQNLDCDSNVWWPPVRCTYTWDASSVPDGNYYIDINIWNEDGLQNTGASKIQFLLDNTPPQASITGVSETVTYEDTVYLNCSDDGSGCIATKWYYFSPTQSCSTNKADYNYSTTANSITITDDHNDYICLWVENRVGLHATAVSDQLHVNTSSWSVTKGASETVTEVASDVNNTCNFTITGEINLACEYQSFVRVRQSPADINRAYTGTPKLVESPEKPIKVILEKAITSFYSDTYFIKFVSDTRTITSQGNEQEYPITIVRRRVVPLLTADGQLDVGTLIIKIKRK